MALVFVATFLAACDKAPPVLPEHVTWTATQIGGEKVLPDPPVVRFWDGDMFVYTGCNWAGGVVYSVEGDQVTLKGEGAVTQRGCQNEEQEQAFLSLLLGTATFDQQGNTLTLTSPRGELVFTQNLSSPETASPEYADSWAQSQLLEARDTVGGHTVENDSYEGFGPVQAADRDPLLVWNDDPVASVNEVSIRVLSPSTVLLATVSQTGNAFCLAYDSKTGPADTTYGTKDAQTAKDCSEPEWPRPHKAAVHG